MGQERFEMPCLASIVNNTKDVAGDGLRVHKGSLWLDCLVPVVEVLDPAPFGSFLVWCIRWAISFGHRSIHSAPSIPYALTTTLSSPPVPILLFCQDSCNHNHTIHVYSSPKVQMPSPIPGSERGRLDDGSFNSSSSFSSEYSRHLIYTPISAPPPGIQPFPTRGFPVEILSYVTDYHAMRRVLRVSRQFHELMLPKLWKHIYVQPQVEGELLSTLASQLDARCSAWKTRGEQVQTLQLALQYTKDPRCHNILDVRDAYLPVQRFLAGLTNMHTLVLEAGTLAGVASRARWRPSDIEMSKQLAGLKTLVFTPPNVPFTTRLHHYNTHPNTRFEQWLLSQANIEYFEYHTRDRLVGAFPATAFPNLRRLMIAVENIEAMRGLEGPRGITHLRMTVPPRCPFIISRIPPPALPRGAPRLPPALRNVTVLVRDDADLEFAGLLPKLERLDIVLKGRKLRRLLAALRAVDEVTGRRRSAYLQGLRFLRVRRLYLTPMDGGNEHHQESGGTNAIGGDGGDIKVAHIFAELPALEEFEAMRDDETWIRFAWDGSTRFVKWKGPSDGRPGIPSVGDEWSHDWEEGVTSVDPMTPLRFRKMWRMPLILRDLESSEPEE
ncbi:hypothetical protein AB1N83_011408 [Pleurotus pulmonarius]